MKIFDVFEILSVYHIKDEHKYRINGVDYENQKAVRDESHRTLANDINYSEIKVLFQSDNKIYIRTNILSTKEKIDILNDAIEKEEICDFYEPSRDGKETIERFKKELKNLTESKEV